MKNMKAIQTDITAHWTANRIHFLAVSKIIDILNVEHPLDYPFSDSLCTDAENYKPVMDMVI
jgi:hypothetical protein